MLGCDIGTLFKVTVAGGSYQETLVTHLQGVPPGYLLTEEEIYRDLLLRKPGQGELTSPRREPDVPIIATGQNCADTMTGFHNANYSNGTPLTILIPNLDRHFEHVEAYRSAGQHPKKLRSDKRHVAGQAHHPLGVSGQQRRVDANRRPTLGEGVGDHRET